MPSELRDAVTQQSDQTEAGPKPAKKTNRLRWGISYVLGGLLWTTYKTSDHHFQTSRLVFGECEITNGYIDEVSDNSTVEVDDERGAAGVSEEYGVSYTFTVEGKKYTGYSDVSDDPERAKTFEVQFLKSDPSINRAKGSGPKAMWELLLKYLGQFILAELVMSFLISWYEIKFRN